MLFDQNSCPTLISMAVMKTVTKSGLGRKACFILPFGEGIQGGTLNAATGAEAMEEGCSPACSL